MLPFSSYRRRRGTTAARCSTRSGATWAATTWPATSSSCPGRAIAGEDPRAARVARLPRRRSTPERGRGLAALGVGAVVVERTRATGHAPAVAGETAPRRALLRVVALGARPGPVRRRLAAGDGRGVGGCTPVGCSGGRWRCAGADTRDGRLRENAPERARAANLRATPGRVHSGNRKHLRNRRQRARRRRGRRRDGGRRHRRRRLDAPASPRST